MDINGAGTLQPRRAAARLQLDAKLTGPIAIENCETLDGSSAASSVRIEGTVTDPEITPDFSKLVQRALRDELQDRIKDRLRDLLR